MVYSISYSCEGRCMRSFHATVEAGAESQCESLGFSSEQVEVRYSSIFLPDGLHCSARFMMFYDFLSH